MIIHTKLLRQLWRPLYHYGFSRRQVHCPAETVINNHPIPCLSQLSNSLTVASETRNTANVCVGIFLDAGSRNESRFENGISHFFEHIVFRGTCSRNRIRVEELMCLSGGRFKTFTTREMCGYYCEVHRSMIKDVVELLADCVFKNSFNACEIEIQKETLTRKLIELDSEPNSLLSDYLHGAAFHGTSLSQPVVGRNCNVSAYDPHTVSRFHQHYFTPARTCLAAVGGVTHECLHALAETSLSHLEFCKCTDCEYRFTAGDFRFRNDAISYCNGAIAFEAPSLCDGYQEQTTMEVAAMYLGGWDRSQVCELHNLPNLTAQASASGFAEAYRTFYIRYHDTGLWGVQFLADRLHIDDLMYNIQTEFMALCNTLTECQAERARALSKLRVMLINENMSRYCIYMARQALYSGDVRSLGQRLNYIDNASAEKIREMCTEYLYDRCPVVAAVGPCECLPDYNRIRSGQHWVRL